MAVPELSDEAQFALSMRPPTSEYLRLALTVVAIVFAALGLTVVTGLTVSFYGCWCSFSSWSGHYS